MLLVSLENYYDFSTNLFKILIIDQNISDIGLIKFENKVNVLGAYDMNRDGLIDILYTDSKDNVSKVNFKLSFMY